MLKRPHVVCLLAGLWASTLAGCGGGVPETTFAAWANGVKSGNFAASWEQLSPQARGTVLQIQVRDGDLLSAANPAAKSALEQAYVKNGIDPKDPSFKQSRLKPVRPSELAADLDGALKQFQTDLSKMPESSYPKLQAVWTAAASSAIGQSRVQGGRATAAVQGKLPHTADNTSVNVVFERVDRLWALADFEEVAASSAVAGGPGAAGAGPGAGGPAGPGGPAGMQPGMAGKAGGPAGAGVGDPKNMPPGGGPMPAGGPMPGAAMPGGPMPGGAGGPAMDPATKAGGPAMAGKAADPKMAMDPATKAGGPAMAGKAADPKMAMDPAKKAGGPAMAGKAADPKMAGGPPGGGPAGAGAAGAGAAGNPKMVGGPGGAGGPGGPGGQQQAEPGSFEYAVLTFASHVASGEYEGLDEIISPRAKDVLAQIRDASADDSTIEDMKELFATAKPQNDSVRPATGGKSVTLKNEDGKSITITAVREKGGFKVKEMKIK